MNNDNSKEIIREDCQTSSSETGMDINNINNNNLNSTTINNNLNNDIFSKQLPKNKSKYILIVVIVLIIVTIVIISVSNKKDENMARKETLNQLEKRNILKFTINDENFYIGKKISEFKTKNYYYDSASLDRSATIASNSITIDTFYNNDKDAIFLGALYCGEDNDCSYDESILIKVNFYKNSNVIIDDFIKIGTNYNDIVEKYGKEDGVFYQDENSLVWCLGEKGKIGEPYYILMFNYDRVTDIKIGVWWYEDEYKHTVVRKNGGD